VKKQLYNSLIFNIDDDTLIDVDTIDNLFYDKNIEVNYIKAFLTANELIIIPKLHNISINHYIYFYYLLIK